MLRPLLRVLISIALPACSALAGGGRADPIVIVADSRRFTGWKAWWTNLYNENHLLFALVTIAIIPTIGLLLGKLTGAMLSQLGINLKSRDLAEH